MCVQALQVQWVDSPIPQFDAELSEERHQLTRNDLARLDPRVVRLLFSAKQEHGISFQLRNFERHLDLFDNRLDELSDNDVAVGEGLRIRGHVACVTANVRNNEITGSGAEDATRKRAALPVGAAGLVESLLISIGRGPHLTLTPELKPAMLRLSRVC
jgi:hypothetical protein